MLLKLTSQHTHVSTHVYVECPVILYPDWFEQPDIVEHATFQ